MIDSKTPKAVYPPDRFPGCIPRHSRPGEVCPLASEHITIIPKADWDAAAAELGDSLRRKVPVVLDQNGVGSCFPSGTLIRMGDGSEKPIESISVLDRVLTAEGNVKTVTQTMVRKHFGDVCRLGISGSHHVRCTPEHPILTRRGYVRAGDLQAGDMVAFPRFAAQSVNLLQTAEFAWERYYTGARRVVRGKCGASSTRQIPGRTAAVLTKSPIPDLVNLTRGFGRLVGLFLAEGCASYGKITYTFAANEEDTLAAEVVRLWKEELDVTARLQIRGNGCVKVNVYGVQWAQLFENLCGKLAHGKRLHPTLCGGSLDFLEGVLSGWCDGDGISPTRFGGTSTSHQLALAMFDIANAIGKQPTIRVKTPKLSHGVKSRQPVWTVEWGEGKLIQLCDYRKEQDAKHVWRRVESIWHEPFDGHVFNLEVEEDHSYVAEGIGVHNCATESTTGSVMLARACQGLEHVLLNPWFIYHTTSGGYDQGSSIDDNLAFARENGIAPESVWPRSKGWRANPSSEAREAAKQYRIEEFYDISNINEFVSALLTGFCVVFGADGHSILGIQHKGSYPLILNSWSTDWEDGGFGKWASYNGISWAYGAFAVRVAT